MLLWEKKTKSILFYRNSAARPSFLPSKILSLLWANCCLHQKARHFLLLLLNKQICHIPTKNMSVLYKQDEIPFPGHARNVTGIPDVIPFWKSRHAFVRVWLHFKKQIFKSIIQNVLGTKQHKMWNNWMYADTLLALKMFYVIFVIFYNFLSHIFCIIHYIFANTLIIFFYILCLDLFMVFCLCLYYLNY